VRLPPEQPTLEGNRVILRPTVAADARSIQRLAGEREIAQTTLTIPHPYPDGAAEVWIEQNRAGYDAGASITFAIVQREGEIFSGVIGLQFRVDAGVAELGYWVGVPYWNRGLATDAGRAILAFGFRELRLRRVFAEHFARNPASGRVMTKLGMRQEGLLREHAIKWNEVDDLVVYGILAREWRALARVAG